MADIDGQKNYDEREEEDGIEISGGGDSFWNWIGIALVVAAIAWGLVSCFKIRCETDVELMKLEIQSQIYKQK